MLTWREADASAFLALYARVVGIDAEVHERARRRLREGMEEDFFQQNNAKLDRALREALGVAAGPYLLATHGKKPHTRRGLALPPDAIQLAV
jgi:hypothetical protein